MENTEANSSEMLKTKNNKPWKSWGGGETTENLGGGDHLSKSMGQGGGRISESEDLIGHRNNPIN